MEGQFLVTVAHVVLLRTEGQLLKQEAAKGVVLMSAPPSSSSNAFHEASDGHSGVPG